jgi:hypothetical protein
MPRAVWISFLRPHQYWSGYTDALRLFQLFMNMLRCNAFLFFLVLDKAAEFS